MSSTYVHSPYFSQPAWENSRTDKKFPALRIAWSRKLVGRLTLLIGAGLMVFLMYQLLTSGFCRDDVCIQKRIDNLRSEKDTYQAKINALNGAINDLKKGFSSGYVIKQIQENSLQNVHPDIIGFHPVPVGLASGTGLSPVYYPSGIEKKILASYLQQKNSPFAHEDILKSCSKARVSRDQCLMLVAISGAESNFGTQFRKKDAQGKIVLAISEGQKKYNPVGLKGGGFSYPTPDGFYIRPFQSWADFWNQYPRIMKSGYFDRGGVTFASISRCYVGGDCINAKPQWTARSEGFYREMVQSLNTAVQQI